MRFPTLLALAAFIMPSAAQAAPVTVGEVQGPVANGVDGSTHASPLAGQTVEVRGLITQKTLARTSSGGTDNGFFLQSTNATADGDPTSSDGVFVYQGRFTDLIGGYLPQVGDEIVISARVTEFFNLTELTGARLVELARSGVDVEAETQPVEADPPDDAGAAERYWERIEGMQASVPAGALSVDGRDVFPSSADGELWIARGDSAIARRRNPFARRVFRDPHPLDNRPPLFDDGNGYRILLASLGVKAAAGDNTTLIAPGRTFQRIRNELRGGIYYAFGKYSVQTAIQPELGRGRRPDTNAPPRPARAGREFAIANYNVENLYDFRDDPGDGCDFSGNTGCPGVSPPFDYVPASQAVYRERLAEQATQIVEDLHSPEILLIQEAEDQDVCRRRGEALACLGAGDSDGRPDTLQELALAISARGGPRYAASSDRDGADDRGIVSGFLHRTDRVEAGGDTGDDPVLGDTPTVSYRAAAKPYNGDEQNPKALNAELPADVDRSTGVDGDAVFTRPPQVGRFRVWRTRVGRGQFTELYAISNHFSSTPDARVGQRREQAAYNAALYEAIGEARGQARRRVVIGGDLNVFPRPDDPFAPGSPQFPSDQLAPLYEAGLGNVFDEIVAARPASAYSYVFSGQAQTLDHQFLSPALSRRLAAARIAHINADWPADEPGDGARGASDHDPLVTRLEHGG